MRGAGNWWRVAAAALCGAAAFHVGAQEPRAAQLVPSAEPKAAREFDPAQSAALFVGVRQFTYDHSLAEVRYAADDAVDLAYALAMEGPVPLVEPRRVVLALSGDPQKPASRAHLEALKKAGAEVRPAGQNDIIALLEEQASRVGPKGIFITGFATHAFAAGGQLYLLASGSLFRRPESSLTTTTCSTSSPPRRGP
jgi:hypothetical protein